MNWALKHELELPAGNRGGGAIFVVSKSRSGLFQLPYSNGIISHRTWYAIGA